MEYLRSDCHNINAFFRKQGVSTLTLRELFEWVVDPNLPSTDDPASYRYLSDMLDKTFCRGVDITLEKEDDAFRFVRIPRNLSVSYPFVRDFLKIQKGLLDPDNIYYAALTGMKSDLTGVDESIDIRKPELAESISSDKSTDENRTETDDLVLPTGVQQRRKICDNARPRDESLNSRRERKKAVKLAQAEKRQNKVPKYIKKSRQKH